ncbi:hypothetical protein BGX27_006793 [Mortierella sp. AM989]|nr:hypothetical protein BGX27_006793 [Mortierella sp. AM989]
MSIYYMTRGKEVFSPQAQALDLCIRLTSCPIFSLPPPQILIKYFRSKYGSAVRDDNPNTMIEEGITNDPRPRRPVMLVSQPTSHSSRRDSDYVFGSAYQERHQNIYSSYSSFEGDDDRCKHYIEEEANIGTNSSLDTAAETSPKLKPLSKLSSSNLKESKTPMSANMDETVLPPLCISIPSEMPSIPNSEEVIITTHPLSFAPGVVHERNEEDETAIAARRISRRLTMEGRKDDLDILNITGLMKRSHRPHSTEPGLKPATSMASLRSTRSSHPPLPTLMSETNFNPSRKPSVLRRGKLSVISDSSMASEEDVMRHETILSRGLDIQTAAMKASEQEQGQGQEKTSDKLPTQTSEHDTQMDTSSNNTALHHPIICENESHINPSSDIASLENKDEHPSDNSPIPISRKVSMNNIRRMSRDAITRFQEGAFAAALSASAATTGPLSLTILRTERNNNNADSAGDRSKKSKAQLKEDHVEHAHLLPT